MAPTDKDRLPEPQTGGTFIRQPNGSLQPVQETEQGLVRKPHPDVQPPQDRAPADLNPSEE